MSKYCPENERVKRDYTFYLEAANGKQNATIDAALWSAPLEVIHPVCWSEDHFWRWSDGNKAPQAGGDRRQAASG
jgi:hypothetical protein